MGAFEVTPETTADSPGSRGCLSAFQRVEVLWPLMLRMTRKNCESIVDWARPGDKTSRGKTKPRGFNARSEMLQWLQDKLDEF